MSSGAGSLWLVENEFAKRLAGDVVTDSQETDGRRAGRGYARCAREKMRRGWGLGGPVPPIPLTACCNLPHGKAKKRLTVSWVRTQLALVWDCE